MTRKRSISRRTLLIGAGTFGFSAILMVLSATNAQAQSFFERIRQLYTRRTPARRTTGRERGGAVRGPCVASGRVHRPLTAMIPEGNLGLTTDSHPTFWFYLPYSQEGETKSAKFTILDDDLNPILERPILVNLPSDPGLVKFRLPTTARSLDVGKAYNWYLSVVCSEANPSRNPVVSGWVQRIAINPQLTQQLQTQPAQQHYSLYAQYDIWYETLTSLAEHRDRYPNEWSNLLGLLNLTDIAQSPIVELQAESGNSL